MKVEEFGPYKLSAGKHDGPEEGLCVMEMVSFLAGEKWSDMPQCSCRVLARYAQVINDSAPQKYRDQLQRLVPVLIDTRSGRHEKERIEHFAWAAIHKFAPIALRAVGLNDHAEKLAQFKGSLRDAASAAHAASAVVVDASASAAHAAAHAAAYAASAAAHAAAHAASASAAHAAHAASAAAAHTAEIWPIAIEVLEEAVKLGPHGQGYTKEHLERGKALHKAITPLTLTDTD